MSNSKTFFRAAILAFAAGAIMAPQAPVLAKGKPAKTSASASLNKPSPTRSQYKKQTTKRKAVRLPTAADVINARAAREHAAHRQTRMQRFNGWLSRTFGRGQAARNVTARQRPGAFARATSWVGGLFSKLKAKARRGSVVSDVVPRLERLPDGTVRQRAG